MKIVDKILKILFMMGISIVLLVGSSMVYVMTLMMVFYKYLRGQGDVKKDLDKLNRSFMDLLKQIY